PPAPLGRLLPRVCLSARSPPPPRAGPNSARPARLTSPAPPPLELKPEPPARPRLPVAARRASRWPTSPRGAVPGPGDTAGGAPAAPSPALASSRSPPWEKLERGRGLGLDRRAPPDGVATVTGWHAKRFEVLTRLLVRPVPRESWFGGGDVPEEVLGGGGGRLGRGLGEKFPPGREERAGISQKQPSPSFPSPSFSSSPSPSSLSLSPSSPSPSSPWPPSSSPSFLRYLHGLLSQPVITGPCLPPAA
ncbi:unnamed protein product, partial [Rangifer tarandus platyrhynchus]